jgi:hypothetical protein
VFLLLTGVASHLRVCVCVEGRAKGAVSASSTTFQTQTYASRTTCLFFLAAATTYTFPYKTKNQTSKPTKEGGWSEEGSEFKCVHRCLLRLHEIRQQLSLSPLHFLIASSPLLLLSLHPLPRRTDAISCFFPAVHVRMKTRR